MSNSWKNSKNFFLVLISSFDWLESV